MKRLLAFLICINLSLAMHIQGQILSSAGIKTGVVIANQSIRFSPLDYYTMETDPLLRPGIGFFFETFSGEKYSLQFDLAYLGKGSKTTTESITVDHLNDDRIIVNTGELVRSRFSYYSFSPLLRYRRPTGNLTTYILLGPRFEILSDYKTGSDYPLEDQNDFLLGMTGAFGSEMEIGNMSVFAELQYQPDLSPVTNEGTLLINNNILYFSLGIRFMNVSRDD